MSVEPDIAFEDIEFVRVSGKLLCDCGREARDHEDYEDHPTFHQLCDGRYVKT